MWYHQHLIGHHVYTNIPGRDPDLYHTPAFVRLSPDVRWRPAHGKQMGRLPLLWLCAVPTLLIIKPLQVLSAGVYNKSVVLMALPAWRVAAHLLSRVGVFASLFVWPWFAFASRAQAAVFAFVPISVFSLLFMACSQVNHHGAEMSAGGAGAAAGAPGNWFRHQAATSHTIAPASAFAFWISGGLNLQAEHHLLPTVNHWHLRKLQPAIEAAARRHGVHYARSDSIAEAFRKLFEHMLLMAVDEGKAE